MIRIGGTKRGVGYTKVIDDSYTVIPCISRGAAPWKMLSPFYLPIDFKTENGQATSLENFWQGSKVYAEIVKHKTGDWKQTAERHAIRRDDGTWDITEDYFKWRKRLFEHPKAIRRPNGRNRPLFSLLGSERFGYIESRKKIYEPLYIKTARRTTAYKKLYEMYKEGKNLLLIDVDGPDPKSFPYGIELSLETIDKERDNPNKVWGHGMVLAKMLFLDIKPGDETDKILTLFQKNG